jgi:hypothetical protein
VSQRNLTGNGRFGAALIWMGQHRTLEENVQGNVPPPAAYQRVADDRMGVSAKVGACA